MCVVCLHFEFGVLGGSVERDTEETGDGFLPGLVSFITQMFEVQTMAQ